MGAGIAILSWLVVFAIGASVWLGSLQLFVAGRRRKSDVVLWLGAVPSAIGSLVAILSLAGAIYGFVWNRH